MFKQGCFGRMDGIQNEKLKMKKKIVIINLVIDFIMVMYFIYRYFFQMEV